MHNTQYGANAGKSEKKSLETKEKGVYRKGAWYCGKKGGGTRRNDGDTIGTDTKNCGRKGMKEKITFP